MSKITVEKYDHDDCPDCGEDSLPAEGVLDQAYRVCSNPLCEKEFWEDLNKPPFRLKFVRFMEMVKEIIQSKSD
jgi:hypothetical protein